MGKSIVISHDKLLELAEPFANLMNAMQTEKGETLPDIATAGLYALGVALASMRVPISLTDAVSSSLAPLWTGYKDFINEPVLTISRSLN